MGGWDRSQSLARNVRESYWAALVVHYADRPAVLAAAIRPARAFALRRVLWGSERTERKAFAGIPFPSWPRLAPTLVAAARNDLDVLAELAPFVVREIGPATEDQALEFDGELCVRLFGSEEIVLRLPWETLPPKFRTGGCGEAVRRAALRVAWAQRLGEREE